MYIKTQMLGVPFVSLISFFMVTGILPKTENFIAEFFRPSVETWWDKWGGGLDRCVVEPMGGEATFSQGSVENPL
jgi:hypothetical protein